MHEATERDSGKYVEWTALIVIGLALALGGKSVLRYLGENKVWALPVLIVIGVALLVAIRRTLRENRADARLEVSAQIAYLCALGLAIGAVAAPARWVVGSAAVMIEIAIGFDLFGRIVRSRRPAA